MRIPPLIFCLMSAWMLAPAQVEKGRIDSTAIPAPGPHFQAEYTFDVSTNPQRWLRQKPGLHVSCATTDKLYFRSEAPELEKETNQWQATGWKGERLNTMILIWSPDTLMQVRFSPHHLFNSKGQIIDRKNLQLQMVRYVVSNYPYNAVNTNCDVSPNKNGYLMPDRFETFDRFDVPGKTVRPVWLSCDIPSTTPPGIYKGTIHISTENSADDVEIQITVQNQLLPKPHDWKYRLDLWQNPWVVSSYYQLKPWSPEHKALLKKHLQLYADAGGKYITTYAIHSPWSDNSYMIEGGMIEWLKQKNGSWKFDYTIFDQYVELAMQAGIDKAITVYTLLPWGNRFRYLEESTGNYVSEEWPPDSKTFTTVWNVFLTDLKAHLDKKGWFEKTYLGINENPMEQTLAAIRVIKAHPAKWKITYAGNWHKELDGLLDDYSSLYGFEPGVEETRVRSSRGATSTYYVCCNPPKPNDFVFSPPAEGRWLSWYAAARGYDGFLRWAYDAWPADPGRDARHILWPAGDCFLVYPGGTSGIRFEKLREGIVDYEKIRILRQQMAKTSNAKTRSLLKELEDHLQSLIAEKEFNEEKIRNDIERGKKILAELSDQLH